MEEKKFTLSRPGGVHWAKRQGDVAKFAAKLYECLSDADHRRRILILDSTTVVVSAINEVFPPPRPRPSKGDRFTRHTRRDGL